VTSEPDKETMPLIDYVKLLEGKDSTSRGEQVQRVLKSLDISYEIQEWRHPLIKNIIVNFSPTQGKNQIIFSAHFDVVKGSPGANDNASGVAVLLGLCQELRQRHLPIRVIFFDREEAWIRTPILKLGLLGSQCFVLTNDPRQFSAVYNLEFCGNGECLTLWPVAPDDKRLPAVARIEKIAAEMNLELKLAHVHWLLLSSDHLSFRLRGIKNSVTLTLLPSSRMAELERLISRLSIPGLLSGKKPVLPEPLSLLHSAEDTSWRLSETSLQLMLLILQKIVEIETSPQKS